MENALVIGLVGLVALVFGFWHKLQQGLIKSAKNHPNFSSDYAQFGQLGKSGTLVQFSTKYCSICPGTKEMLSEISKDYPGVNFIEIDAEANLDLTKRLSILTTPTVLFIDELGEELARFSGRPNKLKIIQYINEHFMAQNTAERLV